METKTEAQKVYEWTLEHIDELIEDWHKFYVEMGIKK